MAARSQRELRLVRPVGGEFASDPWRRPGTVDVSPVCAFLDRAALNGESLPWVIEYEGRISGQLSVMNITLGSLRGASIGYWVSQEVAGRGIAPLAVAMAVDYCLFERHLHRIEINVRPENHASLRVVEKLGFRDEGIRERYLHINGRWADHRTFALTREDIPLGLLHQLRTRATPL